MSTVSMHESTVTTPGMAAFDDPPADPIALFSVWLAEADGVVAEPTAAALATVDRHGTPSNRMIRILHVAGGALVFSSHSVSRKGRDAAETGVGSAVLYWRETGQQITVGGRLRATTEAVSDRLWDERDSSTYPMSVATVQSADLADEHALRDRADALAATGPDLPRPATWVGYELVPDSIEFWHVGTDRLHLRLRYDLADGRWTARRLQP